MKQLKRHKQFVKDWNKARITEGQFSKFIHYADCLQQEEPLPEESKDHALIGEYQDYREFHLGGDMLIIYLDSKETITVSFLNFMAGHDMLYFFP